MAAVTVTNRRETFTSNRRVVTATVTAAATGDTWDSLNKVNDWVGITARTSTVTNVTATQSGGVTTINYGGGGAATFFVIAIGT